ncbi:solute carrier family 2, facilitated glucose transporter member 5-like [Salarias fasciatus]|uniref:solute carrier family 2, facilitated glucose transporter member 5-like n=1 Tax=Salarias fasciatus TaxID=181472 RepID=UPI00117669EA|nr:solute carrier family 2, facilitated glucose transporter member 5-like [Salarias fasciatus]
MSPLIGSQLFLCVERHLLSSFDTRCAKCRHPVLIFVVVVCGLSGPFHYGYNISAMNSPSKVPLKRILHHFSHVHRYEFIKALINDTLLERYNTTLDNFQVSLMWSITVSLFSLGGAVGSAAAGFLLSIVGRKKCMLLNAILVMAAAVLMLTSKYARSFEMIMIGRFLYGMNAAISLAAHTMYMTECAPKHLKGAVGQTIINFTCLGRLCGMLLGLSELLGNEDYWNVLLGFIIITAFLLLVSLAFLPESPSFLLLNRGDRLECERALKKLWGDGDHSGAMEEMLQEKAALETADTVSVCGLIRDKRVRWQLITLIVTFVSLPLSGVIAVYFYSFEVFRAAGLEENLFPYLALGMGAVEFVSSLLAFPLFVRKGTRFLLMMGYGIMAGTLVCLTISLALQSYTTWMPYVSMALIFIFIAGCAMGPAAATPPLPTQIFPHAFKSAALSLGSGIAWTILFTISMSFSFMVEGMRQYCFLIFLVFCVGCGLFVTFKFPDIKNHGVHQVAVACEMRNGAAAPAVAPENDTKKSNGQVESEEQDENDEMDTVM